MIETIIDPFFTESVVEKMGDWYPVVYSWAVFAVVAGLVLCGVVLIGVFARWLLRWFR